MFARFSRLLELLESFGGIGSATKIFSLLPGIAADVQALADAEGSREYHEVAVSLLRRIAPLTSNDLDNGLLIALEALTLSAEWHGYLDAKLAAGGALGDEAPSGIPEGALGSVYAVRDKGDLPPLPEGVEPMIAGKALQLIQWLPALLELIRELRAIADDYRNASSRAA